MKSDALTEAVRKLITEEGGNLKWLAQEIGISYSALYSSIGASGRGRPLRAEEFMTICGVLGLDPWDFVR